MNKRNICVLAVAFCFLINAIGCKAAPGIQGDATPYGQLSVHNGMLTGAAGNPVQLKGMSTHGLHWYYQLVNESVFDALKNDWKSNVIRLAMYINENGYKNHPNLLDFVEKGIELAVKKGMYIIVDWHVLNPGNPNDPIYAGAENFFKQIAKKYGKYENVIYEIMNEPNGKVTWKDDLKPYAQKMVDLIRKYDPDNIILIGSSLWSQDVDKAAADPVKGENLMYTVHFYSGTHGAALRKKIEAAQKRGAGVFCSEWGTSEANGTGGPFLKAADEWLAFFDKNNISWVNWSLANKAETSAALVPGAPLVPDRVNSDGIPYWPEDQLSESGRYIRAKMRGE